MYNKRTTTADHTRWNWFGGAGEGETFVVWSYPSLHKPLSPLSTSKTNLVRTRMMLTLRQSYEVPPGVTVLPESRSEANASPGHRQRAGNSDTTEYACLLALRPLKTSTRSLLSQLPPRYLFPPTCGGHLRYRIRSARLLVQYRIPQLVVAGHTHHLEQVAHDSSLLRVEQVVHT